MMVISRKVMSNPHIHNLHSYRLLCLLMTFNISTPSTLSGFFSCLFFLFVCFSKVLTQLNMKNITSLGFKF